jgi:methylase of polypeptide subunit release factors
MLISIILISISFTRIIWKKIYLKFTTLSFRIRPISEWMKKAEIADSVKEFEPKMALFSPTSNALIFYEKIADDCKNHLAENGMVFLEINQKLGEETKALFTDVLSEVYLVKDISGNDRFVWGKK